jgi:glycosyltransferase involved in cell wall biosynthesis
VPIISVIIPAYNAQNCIGRAIDSVLAQIVLADEIIVVDDGSTDKTAEIVKQYSARVRYIYQPNGGVSAARNTGISAAAGDWIAFLDADDEWLPEKLYVQMNVIKKNPDIFWCATNVSRCLDRRQAPFLPVKHIDTALCGKDYFESYFQAASKKYCHLFTPTVLVRKDMLFEAGLFEKGRTHSEDFDLWLRIAYNYPKLGFIAEPQVLVHLEIDDPVLTERRLRAKRGADDRDLIAKHLALSRHHNAIEIFKPLAALVIHRVLITAMFHGYGEDVRTTVRQFPELLSWRWRILAYISSVFPRSVACAARALAYMAHLTGFERQVSRRWTYKKTTSPR